MQHTPVHPTQGALPVPNAATPVPMIAIRRRIEHVTCGAAADQIEPNASKTTVTRRMSCAIS
ncbi:MAG TPA: hypothetical protein PK440_21360 [Candidatus Accumulibacter phosphatis]|nr:hypothetical protein [Candidatus Accumulibacter phosphatis]HRQ97506.1 hypothetical protein [Candidatus Accumulibacter phosphatis]